MKKVFFYTIAVFCLLTGMAFTLQEIINWKIDKENAQVKFAMKAHGQELIGNFKNVKGNIKFDPNDLENSSFNCDVEVAGINTGVVERNGHLQGEKWFDATNYPNINFTSSKITLSEDDNKNYIAMGTLSMKGATKEIIIPFSIKENKKAAKADGIIFIGDFVIKRSDFNVGKADGEVGDDIALHLEIPVTQEK